VLAAFVVQEKVGAVVVFALVYKVGHALRGDVAAVAGMGQSSKRNWTPMR